MTTVPEAIPVSITARPARPPGSPHVHPFRSAVGQHVLVPDGSRVYDVDRAVHDELTELTSGDPDVLRDRLRSLGLEDRDHVGLGAGPTPPVRYLSLAVAQSCNLGCGYCYASGGDFAMTDRTPMTLDVATATIDALLADCRPGDRAGIAFLGGEPLANRSVLHAATRHGAAEAARRDVTLQWSVTTNGTMVRADDIDLFDEHAFAVTVSLDGIGDVHDRLRPTRGGAATYERIVAAVEPMLTRQGRLQVGARVTVTPENTDLAPTLLGLTGLGFRSVGFSPAVATPTGASQVGAADLDRVLAGYLACSDEFVRSLDRGRPLPFSNLTSALQLIHRGAHRPLPCGAGAAYLGVSAAGELSACHRFVGDDRARMGDLASGWDDAARDRWVAERHVDRQEPCRSCWARYLCGGGCHHEVLAVGRPTCDFIRAWLEHCLRVYVEVSARHPNWFARDLTFR